MNRIVFLLFILSGAVAQATQIHQVQTDVSGLQQEAMRQNNESFTKIQLNQVQMEKELGAPELPVRSWLVQGHPENIQVDVSRQSVETFSGRPYPVQEQECRCANDRKRTFQFNRSSYEQSLPMVDVSYLGTFRGTPISRVDVRLGKYEAARNQFQITTSAEVRINVGTFELTTEELKDYLIVVPTNLADGVVAFADYKRSRNYNVHIMTVESPANTTAAIQEMIKNAYTEKGIDFVIMVGDEMALPMFKVPTTGSSSTPSDLKYFTMDGANDYIPEMFASRISASTPEQVRAQLDKSIEFEKVSYQNANGLKKFIGIASNEGSNPSDDEYVRSIGEKFRQTMGANVVHLHQNDKVNSNPEVLNSTLNDGSFWLTYLGHGSGTSWPSMYQYYTTNHIRQLINQTSVKPIIIDVACQNGRLTNGRLGTTFMKAEGAGFGAAAYYGGTVDISWHPPAIMARGIAYEQMDKKFRHIGVALLAGQFYLAANWNKTADVIDNFEWYHLQGDPGMELQF